MIKDRKFDNYHHKLNVLGHAYYYKMEVIGYTSDVIEARTIDSQKESMKLDQFDIEFAFWVCDNCERKHVDIESITRDVLPCV